MKKSLLSFILLISLSSLKSQVPYTPFNFEASSWSEFSYSGWFVNTYSDVTVSGDTVINNVGYYKLHREGMYYVYETPNIIEDSTAVDEYVGAIRENDQKQILFIDPESQEEIILFDYNLNLGDTVNLASSGFLEEPGVVNQIDTIEVCGTERNRYKIRFVESEMETYLIEGIGSSAGIIPEYEIFESGSKLLCYSTDGCECGILVSIEETFKALANVNIYPNPVSDQINIEFTDEVKDIEITILNTLGQTILTRNLSGDTNISCSHWDKGVYFVRLKSDRMKGTLKILKH